MTSRGFAVAATALLLAACGPAGEAAQTATTTTTSGPSVKDTAYLTRVRATVQGGDDAGLIAAGKDACKAMADGATTLDAVSRAVASGFSTADAAAIVTAADATYC